jgi:hypothetical protein
MFVGAVESYGIFETFGAQKSDEVWHLVFTKSVFSNKNTKKRPHLMPPRNKKAAAAQQSPAKAAVMDVIHEGLNQVTVPDEDTVLSKQWKKDTTKEISTQCKKDEKLKAFTTAAGVIKKKAVSYTTIMRKLAQYLVNASATLEAKRSFVVQLSVPERRKVAVAAKKQPKKAEEKKQQ